MTSAPGYPQDPYLYYGNLGVEEPQYKVPNFVGLALYPKHDRERFHNVLEPLPFADSSIRKIQSQDVFEHLPKESLPTILDEIFRVLAKGGIFRLSVPDYRSPLLRKRSVYDHEGRVMADLMMGGQAIYDQRTGHAVGSLGADGDAHIWFPTYEQLLEILLKSNIRCCERITFYHYFIDDERYVCNPFPLEEMFVGRAPPSDMRADGKPISIIVDLIK